MRVANPVYTAEDIEYLDQQHRRLAPEFYEDWIMSEERAQILTLTSLALEQAKDQAFLYGLQAASLEDQGKYHERTQIKIAWKTFINQFHGNFRDTIRESYWDAYLS